MRSMTYFPFSMTNKNNILKAETYSQWYENVYPDLTGHGIWLRGNELNTIPPEGFEKRPFRILIARLSTCFDTAESFSHKILYQIARSQKDIYPDFSFLPPAGDALLFARDNVPWLLGTTTKRGPRDFDLIAFSNAIVQELINVPVMLEKSGVPKKKSERLADAAIPLLILGGSNALHASIFFVPDPPVDGIFIGESTDCISRLFCICADAKEKGLTKQETLAQCETVPGFVQPDRPVRTKRRYDTSPCLNSLLEDAPVFFTGEQPGRGNLQLSEGCPSFCSFCSESFCRKPYREVCALDIIEAASRMKAGMGLDRVELYSFNFNMHSGFSRIIDGLTDLFGSIGLKSQRFDILVHDPGMLRLLHAIGKSSLTCGLEGISPRLRRYLHKSLSEKDLEKSLSLIFSSPVRELKIFLIATGKEEKNDFSEFADLLDFLSGCIERAPTRPRMIFSVTPLVRFPWTPLEFEDAPAPDALRPIISRLHDMVTLHRFEFRLSSDLNDYLLSQIMVRAADARIFHALLDSIHRTGYVYYRNIPSSFINTFVSSLDAAGLSVHRCLSGAAVKTGEKPWLFFDTGVDRNFLALQYEAASSFTDNGYCLGLAGKKGSCKACGACDDTIRKAILAPRHKSQYSPSSLNEKVARLRSSTETLSLFISVGDGCRGLPRSALAAALGRALMKTDPGCIPFYRGYCRSYWSQNAASCWATGDDIITLLWHASGIATVKNLLEKPKALSQINSFLGDWGSVKRICRDMPSHCVLHIRSPFQFAPNDFFPDRGLSFILRRSKEGTYSLEFTRQALQKKLIVHCSYTPLPTGGTELVMTVTPKFNTEEFLREAFKLGKNNEWVRTRLTARFPGDV